jgi:hypothetical protein
MPRVALGLPGGTRTIGGRNPESGRKAIGSHDQVGKPRQLVELVGCALMVNSLTLHRPGHGSSTSRRVRGLLARCLPSVLLARTSPLTSEGIWARAPGYAWTVRRGEAAVGLALSATYSPTPRPRGHVENLKPPAHRPLHSCLRDGFRGIRDAFPGNPGRVSRESGTPGECSPWWLN